MPEPLDPLPSPRQYSDPHNPSHLIVPLRVIVGLLLLGALYLTQSIVVPFLVAMVLAIALEPVVVRLRRLGIPNALACLAGMLLVAGALIGVGVLITVQTAAVFQDSGRHIEGFSRVFGRVAQLTGAERLLDSLGTEDRPQAESGPAPKDEPRSAEASRGQVDPTTRWIGVVRRNAERIGSYLVTGLGGLIGTLGSLVLLLAFLFYMLLTREDWMGRTTLAMTYLGMRPGRRELELIQQQMVKYLGRLGLVSLTYVVFISAALWIIGVPQPLLWGVLTGVLEIVPYIGAVIAAALPTIVSLGSGTLTQPLLVIGLFLVLQTIEGYVVAPLLYGDAVDINPVTVLLGVLFFGWLLGPWGLILAMPLLILIRGLLILAPDTPALDVMLEADKQEAAVEASETSSTP